MIGSSFSPLSGLVYLSQLGRTNGGSLGGGKGHFGMFSNQGNNATEIKISFPGWGTQFTTDLSLSIPSVSPWLGRFELAQVWVATKFGHSLSYSNYYNPNGTITFPGIDNQHPRWAVIRSTSLLTVPALKSELVFDIYPNPVDNHQFTIRLAENSNIPAQWVIRDMQGRQLLQGEINLFENKIVLPDLASGLYFLEVKSGLKFGSQKVIIH